MSNRKVVYQSAFLACVLSLGVAGLSCEAGRQVGQSMREFYAQGNLTVLMCNRPDLDGCVFLPTVNISGGPVKVNTNQLPAEIGDNNVRSLSVVCGRPTAVIAYEHCNFRGSVVAFHCVPGQTLEVRHLGSIAGAVSSLAFSDETQTEDLQHTAIPFSQSAIDALHQGISAALDLGSTGTSTAGSSTDCAVIPQCCHAGAGTPQPGNEIEEAFPLATEVYWTEPINVFPELPQYGETVGRIDPCPVAGESERKQLLVVAHHTEINPNNWPSNYITSLYWYFEPILHQDKLFLRLHRFAVKAEEGSIHDSLVTGIGSHMSDAGTALACQILREVKLQADLRVTNAGAAVLQDNTRITWTFADPLLCNQRRRTGIACGNYVAIPPTLILHKE